MKRLLPIFASLFILIGAFGFLPVASADDYTVSGLYQFNDYLDIYTMPDTFFWNVNFSCNGVDYTAIVFDNDDVTLGYYTLGEVTLVYRSDNSSWIDQAFKTLDFGTDAQTVDASLYEFLVSNGTFLTETVAPYYSIYNLIGNAIYGATEDLSGDQTLVLTALATTACLFLVVLPFLVVWLVIRIILGFFGDR